MRPVIGLFAILLLPVVQAQAPPTIAHPAMDAVLAERIEGSTAPGICALVVKGGNVIYRRAMGSSNLMEPLATDAVFRIGSVTKQFTAMAILQLVQQGKLVLTDEIQTYLDFPRKDWPVTVHHLLTHTAGVPNYTDLPSFTPEVFGKDVTLAGVMATFKDLPLEFEPGTRWSYSNSGYILLGALIERLTGMTWDMCMQENFFGPLGMAHSSASPTNALLPGEAHGYQKGATGWEPATPLSMTWPHAAGAIRSSVDDLWAWNRAVFAHQVLPEALLSKAHTDARLKDSTACAYGYGWNLLNVQGTPTIEHGGGIHGFVSASLYVPQEDVYVAVLCNSTALPADVLAAQLAAIAMDKPYGGTEVALGVAELGAYAGVYLGTDSAKRYITAEPEGLFVQREGSAKHKLVCFGPDRFGYEGDVTSLEFMRAEGRITGGRLRSRTQDLQLGRMELPLPVREAIKADPRLLKRCAGVFELAPGFTMTFRSDGARFFGQATGQPEFELFADGAHTFFLKVVDARVVFYPEPDGQVDRMKLFQGGEQEGRRVK